MRGELPDDVASRALAERGEDDHGGDADRARRGATGRCAAGGPRARRAAKREHVARRSLAALRGRQRLERLLDAARPPRGATMRAVGEDEHAPRAARDAGVVGDDDEGQALGVHALEQLEDLAAGGGVEVAGRLVGEQQPRLA